MPNLAGAAVRPSYVLRPRTTARRPPIHVDVHVLLVGVLQSVFRGTVRPLTRLDTAGFDVEMSNHSSLILASESEPLTFVFVASGMAVFGVPTVLFIGDGVPTAAENLYSWFMVV